MGRQTQDVFSQMFLRHTRMRSRRRLMQVVPTLALRLMMRLLFAGEQAACVKMQNLRHRYFSVLLGSVPGENCPPYLHLMMRLLCAGEERAASVKVSGSGIFAPIQPLSCH